MSSTYEHYFVADGGRVVSHKPVNLCVWAKCGGTGPARAFTLAVKTSDDKIKRRLNKTEAIDECFLCCDNDPAYQRRRAQQDAAAAAAALLGYDAGSAAAAAAAAPVPSTKAQMAARQEQLHYIGSKEIFTQHPGDKIVCLRLRAAEEIPARKSGKSKKKGASALVDDAEPPEGADPGVSSPPPDVGEVSNDGFLFHVETKGGKSLGRQKQHYILLRSRCIYTLLLPSDVVVTRIETKDKRGETMALKHWISAHAQLATGPTASPTKFSEPEPEVAPLTTVAAPVVVAAVPVTQSAIQQQQQQAVAFMTASSLHAATAAAFSAQLQMGNSPLSSTTLSPASMSAALAQPAAAPGSGISPTNHPFLFPFHTPSPQQAAQMMLHQQQQQYLAASSALAGLSGFAAPSALSMMLPSSGPNSRGHTNFPSPSSVLLSNFAVANAFNMAGGVNAVGAMGHSSSMHMSPALSNPSSGRSMSNNHYSPSNGVLLHTQQAHANTRQDSPPAAAGAVHAEQMSPDADTRQIQQQIQQLQAILNQQTQLAKHQMQFEQHQFIQQQQQQQQQQTQQHTQTQQTHLQGKSSAFSVTKATPPSRSRSKFDFSVANNQHHSTHAQFPPAHVMMHPTHLLHQQQQQQQLSPTRVLYHQTASKGFADPSGGDPLGHVKLEPQSFPDSPQFAPSHLRALQRSADSSSAGSTATNSLNNSVEGFPRSQHQQQQQQHAHLPPGLASPPPTHTDLSQRYSSSPPSGVDPSCMMQLDSHPSPGVSALHTAYWNPPAPPAMAHAPAPTHATDLTSSSMLMGSHDFLADDFFADAAGLHQQHPSSLEVHPSFFNSPLVHDSTESAGSSNGSHASQHSPAAHPMRLQSRQQQQQQQQAGGLSRSPSVDSLVPASTLAAALRPPVFPLLGPNCLLDPSPRSSSSSASGGGGGRRAAKRKKKSSSGLDRRDSASSSVVSESARPRSSVRRGTGFTLSPRLWKVALKRPPFRATLSVTRSSTERFRSSDMVQIRFGGDMLDASRVDVYKRQVLIDIPPPPSTAALMSAAGVGGAAAAAAAAGPNGALPHTTIEVDLDLIVNGVLKFSTCFSYKLGPAHSRAAGDPSSSSSSEGDSDDSGGGDRSDSASDNEGAPDSPDASPDSPDAGDDASGGSSKRRKADEGSNGGGGGGGGGSSQYGGGVPRQSVRLSADLDSIPLFSRGVLKSFPLLSLGLQELLQSYLLQSCARGSAEDESSEEAVAAAAAAVHDQMIVEEVDGVESTPSHTLAARSSPPASASAWKRYSTGSHVLSKVRMSPPSGPATVPNTPVSRSPLRPRSRSTAMSSSAANRAAARILFVQAITSQQPMQLVHAALSAAIHAALHSDTAAAAATSQFQGINGADSFGFTLLHYAVAVGSLQLVETLLSLGANPGIQARSNHASHAFTPAQLLQLRVVAEQQHAARREARAAKKTLKASNALPSAALGSPQRLLSRHGNKKRRTNSGGLAGLGEEADANVNSNVGASVGDDDGSLASGPSQSGSTASSGNSDNGQHSGWEESAAMVDGSSGGLSSPQHAQAQNQPLVLGFSSLHSLAPSPFGSAHSSAASSLANTPTNAAASSALKAARTPLTGRDILAATQSGHHKKSFHFGLADRASTGATLSSSPPADKVFHMQMQQQHPHAHQHQQQALHVFHSHHHLAHHAPFLDKTHAAAAAAASGSTATTAAPTPTSHINSVLSSPMPNMWRPSPLYSSSSSMRSPPLGSLTAHLGVPALVAPSPSAADAAELNRQLGVVFHAHALTPQGLAMAAALAQAQSAHAATEQLQSTLPSAPNPALTVCPKLQAYVERRWKHCQAKKQLLSLQRQLRQQMQLQSPHAQPTASSTMVQSEEDREQQRETVMLELAMLIQHAQKHVTALKLHVPSSAAVAPVATDEQAPQLLSGPMRSLHIHTLSSLLSQFHLLRRYFVAYRKHQTEQAQLNNALADIKLDDRTEVATEPEPQPQPQQNKQPSAPRARPSISSVRMSAFEPVSSEPTSLSASPTSATSSSCTRSASGSLSQAQAPSSLSPPLSDASIIELFAHVATVECVLRDQIVHMQRALAPYMQRAMLQAKMHKEKSRAQMQTQVREAAVGTGTSASTPSSGVDVVPMLSPRPPTSHPLPTPLSQGHMSRTHSGQLSLNIVGSINPDHEDDETACIRVREIHGVDVLRRDGQLPGRRIDLAINAALEEQESAAEVARDSARKQHGRNWEGDVATAASSRLQSPAAILAATNTQPADLPPALFVAPHSTPAASVVSTPAARDSQSLSFQFHCAGVGAGSSMSSPRAASIAAASAAASTTASTSGGHKFALLVGLNHYAPSMSLAPLLGCENDVSRIAQIIQQRFGYDAPRVVTGQDVGIDSTTAPVPELDRSHCRSLMLLNGQATCAALRRALVSLVSAAHSPSDSVLIYFSGHGRASSLLLFDGPMEYAELTHLLRDIRTSDVTFVSDTCATDAADATSHATTAPAAAAAASSSGATAATVTHASSRNQSLTLDELRRLVGAPDAATAAAAAARQHAAASILAAISPQPPSIRRIAPRLDLSSSSSSSTFSSPIPVMRAVGGAADQADDPSAPWLPALSDADVSDSPSNDSDDDMDTQSVTAAPAASAATATAAPSKRSSGGGGARVQYRGLAFNQLEPREPCSDEPCAVAPAGSASGSACSDAYESDDDEGADGSSAVFPVIQRLLHRRGVGYFARGLLSRSDARASEVRLQDGTWHGAYTKRLCDKLERFAAEAEAEADADGDADAVPPSRPSRRSEPANPRIVRLSAVLFHDEEDGNLSGRDCSGAASLCVSSSSSRSHSICLGAGSHLPLSLLAPHQADEIDPTSDAGGLDFQDLTHLFASARLNGQGYGLGHGPDAEVETPVSPFSLADSASDDDNGDQDARACADQIAALDAADACVTDDAADEQLMPPQLQEEGEGDVQPSQEPTPAAVVAAPSSQWLALLLSIWTLVRVAIGRAPAAATPQSDETTSPAPSVLSAHLPIVDSLSLPSFSFSPSPSPSPSPSLALQQHVAADLLTTEAASDSSSGCSGREHGASCSDSDVSHTDDEQRAAANCSKRSLSFPAHSAPPAATMTTRRW